MDFSAGWVRLEPGETKNRRGRQFPLIPRLREILEQQYERKQRIEREREVVITWVFFYANGRRISNFYGAWRSARKAAGMPHLIPHDYRRTAVRNLERSGVARSTAMAMVGHETEAIYRRYAIQEERSPREGGAKPSEHYAGQPTGRKVVPLDRAADP